MKYKLYGYLKNTYNKESAKYYENACKGYHKIVYSERTNKFRLGKANYCISEEDLTFSYAEDREENFIKEFMSQHNLIGCKQYRFRNQLFNVTNTIYDHATETVEIYIDYEGGELCPELDNELVILSNKRDEIANNVIELVIKLNAKLDEIREYNDRLSIFTKGKTMELREMLSEEKLELIEDSFINGEYR